MVNEKKDYISIVILFFVNLLNYVDRYTIAGLLTQVQSFYNVDDAMAGLIQSTFLVFYMVGSPLCGYLGDRREINYLRFNRKLIIIVGMTLWLAAVTSSSFVPPQYFWIFLLFRGIVGIGEASYASVCPSIISDMFYGKARSHMYMLFYFAIPIGSGLGFVVGTKVASLMGAWQWGVRVSVIAGIIVLVLLAALIDEPKRGAAEEIVGAHLQLDGASSFWQDIKSLACIPTFLLCICAYAALVFVTGTLTWWEPTIIKHSIAWDLGLNDTQLLPNDKKNNVGLIFGAITAVSGLIGVSVGSLLSHMIRQGCCIFRALKTERAPPIISGMGALITAPILLLMSVFGHKNLTALLVRLIFIGITCLCFNLSLNVDMLMSVIVPWRRSTAFSYFMLTSHLFGDTAAPYIIGAVSDAIRGNVDTPEAQYISLVKSCSVTIVLISISGVFYMICATVLLKDQVKFKKEMGMITSPLRKSTSSNASNKHFHQAPEDAHCDFIV
ncbi:hypothetical protein Angca_009920 [Angiostrongylus cantonensis]|nr:hypothetical protein Angca_009920 [Angiostrongylus cantonensis]